ncbi:hypothetical protein DC498_02145 [Terrimonas sp.]|uniref:hypothetical protein n=1 Tax=Terrimonas sp. TaxID=1914338 RepID=UPI000D513796|nr:hypothetical protein [Terrimonas sp.]PVD54204.1 hypothetical protein DC498_02145 [Terrimonas sp.]
MHNTENKIMFAFSEELDTAFLYDLYGDDLQQAEMVFESSAQQIKTEIVLAQARFYDSDLQGLKKVIHKMKPLFGYIGMNEAMEEFAAFEKVCQEEKTAADIEQKFQYILITTQQSLLKAEKEVKRLKQFNTQYL